jgi:hypothetical protein
MCFWTVSIVLESIKLGRSGRYEEVKIIDITGTLRKSNYGCCITFYIYKNLLMYVVGVIEGNHQLVGYNYHDWINLAQDTYQ